MEKLINKIYIKHYRGFKTDEELCLELSEPQKISFLVGPNNSGKSLITRLFSVFNFSMVGRGDDYFNDTALYTDHDYFELNTSDPLEFRFEINSRSIRSTDPDLARLRSIPELSLCIKVIKNKDRSNLCVYLKAGQIESHNFTVDPQDKLVHRYNEKFSQYAKMSKDESRRSCIQLYEELKKKILVFDSIRAFDRINGSSFFVSGSGLIEWIEKNVNPGEIIAVKRKVKNWLSYDFNLEAPQYVGADKNDKTLTFEFEDYLKLSSKEVGTGYTMLYILLAEIARNTKEIIIIDEIESHLQPGLIRILMKIIRNHGSAQYIIATHSPTVMESSIEGDLLYRFKKTGKNCSFEGFFRDHTTTSSKDAKILREVCNELGIVPGDALLSNTVIWVEGPSEVFWIRAWLNSYLPIYKTNNRLRSNLIEGLHYSILMTGGNSIAHLSFSENEMYLDEIEEEFPLHVLRVNPNPFVMIDSDNASTTSRKYRRMLQIAKELNEQNSLNASLDSYPENELINNLSNIPNLWILKGRELENYVHPQLLKDFYIERSNQNSSKITGTENCVNWDPFSTTKGVGSLLEERGISHVSSKSGTIAHKDALARYVFNKCSLVHFEEKPNGILQPNPSMLIDLKKNLDKLITYIIKVCGVS